MMTSFCFQTSLLVVIVYRLLDMTKAVAPIITGLPTTVYVGELETGSRLLYTYSISDPNGNAFTCANQIDGQLSGAAVADNDDESILKYNTKTGNYELWTNSATYDNTVIDTYVNTITCTDSNGETSSGTHTVDMVIVNNEALTINNVENNDLTLNALTTGQGTTVKTVSSTSQGGNTVQYSMVSDPSFSPEFFTINPSTGAISTNRDLKYLDIADTTVYLSITAYDTVDQIRVYATQTVNLQNQNTLASATNMITPLQETKLETLAAGTVLFTVSTADPDSQTHTYRFNCDPINGEEIFEIDANGNFMVATGESMDYETISFYNCSFYIFDEIEESGPFIYELTVANDNEAPVFSDTMYYATTSEGAKGSMSFNPGFTCTDPDSGDSTTYDFQAVNNSDRFSIDSDGVITFNTDYDVDNSAMPSSVVLTVYCIDSGHIDGTRETGSAQVTITINDVNDNEPVFSSPAYTITVDQTVSPGSVIGSISPTDADSVANGNPTCSGVSSSAYGAYYTIGADCNVYLSKTIDFAAGTHVGYIAYATDDGTNPQRTGTTAVDIIYQEVETTTTTTTTTTTAYDFFDHDMNIALFVLSLLMGLALLGLLTWCLMRMCCGGGGMCDCANMCDCRNQGRTRRYPRRAITPESPPPRKRRPPSPIIEQPRPVVQKQVPVQVVRTIARPAYGGFRPIPPPRYPIMSAPSLPGYFP